MSFRDEVVIGKMANAVRDRESLIMETIFNHHPLIETKTINAERSGIIGSDKNIKIEGGDFQVAREDVLVIGTGIRTSTQGIDFILENIKARKEPIRHVIVQELPDMPESFIHLDMVFTFLDRDACMVYEPLIMGTSRFHTIHIQVENGEVTKISEHKNLVKALQKLGMDMKPIHVITSYSIHYTKLYDPLSMNKCRGTFEMAFRTFSSFIPLIFNPSTSRFRNNFV